MNNLLKAAEVFRLKDMIGYEKDSIANIDLVAEKNLKFMILSFDEGCALSEHRAPGDALLFALEGKAVIGYEGKQYPIQEGENFRFENERASQRDGRRKIQDGTAAGEGCGIKERNLYGDIPCTERDLGFKTEFRVPFTFMQSCIFRWQTLTFHEESILLYLVCSRNKRI